MAPPCSKVKCLYTLEFSMMENGERQLPVSQISFFQPGDPMSALVKRLAAAALKLPEDDEIHESALQLFVASIQNASVCVNGNTFDMKKYVRVDTTPSSLTVGDFGDELAIELNVLINSETLFGKPTKSSPKPSKAKLKEQAARSKAGTVWAEAACAECGQAIDCSDEADAPPTPEMQEST